MWRWGCMAVVAGGLQLQLLQRGCGWLRRCCLWRCLQLVGTAAACLAAVCLVLAFGQRDCNCNCNCGWLLLAVGLLCLWLLEVGAGQPPPVWRLSVWCWPSASGHCDPADASPSAQLAGGGAGWCFSLGAAHRTGGLRRSRNCLSQTKLLFGWFSNGSGLASFVWLWRVWLGAGFRFR